MREKIIFLFKLSKPLIKVMILSLLLFAVVWAGYSIATYSVDKDAVFKFVLKFLFVATYFIFNKIYDRIRM